MTKDGYYTSGEFAKKANVTLRTIRYYDRQGILKPSKVADNGYRLYTDADFAKLQKILSLKYLGFSLEEIMTMTINDEDQDFIKESIGLQLYLVQKKMEHFANVGELLAVQPFDSMSDEGKNLANKMLDVKSDYFKIQVEVILSNRKRQLSSHVFRKDKQVTIYARSMAPFIFQP